MPSIQNKISFQAVADKNAEVLILGTMPGELSLSTNQYYAHSRNTFWKIMGGIIGFDSKISYSEKLDVLKNSKIALWDVLQSCKREGSLDAKINNKSIVPNDFNEFFEKHPNIRLVCFNGVTAQEYYQKYILPNLKNGNKNINHHIDYVQLPSTSPAHTTMPLLEKIKNWKVGLTIQGYKQRIIPIDNIPETISHKKIKI